MRNLNTNKRDNRRDDRCDYFKRTFIDLINETLKRNDNHIDLSNSKVLFMGMKIYYIESYYPNCVYSYIEYENHYGNKFRVCVNRLDIDNILDIYQAMFRVLFIDKSNS